MSIIRGFSPWTRHTLILTVAGLVYTALGISYFVLDDEEYLAAVDRATQWMPVNGLAIVWVVVGLFVFFSAISVRTPELWGYSALTGLSTAWAAFYLIGVVVYNAPLEQLNLAIIWGLLGFLWWAISGMIDPEIRG
jgi:ascorbate-specific PTS system EIIC-type component UlaA